MHSAARPSTQTPHLCSAEDQRRLQQTFTVNQIPILLLFLLPFLLFLSKFHFEGSMWESEVGHLRWFFILRFDNDICFYVHIAELYLHVCIYIDAIYFCRCACYGSDKTCSIRTGGTYQCSCNPSSHTEKDYCRDCKAEYYREPEEFGCIHPCNCNITGSRDNKCEQVNEP